MRKTDVVIIGGGPAGVATAIWCERLGLPHLLLESRTSLGGQLRYIHNPIIDYPGLLAPSGAELQQRLSEHVEQIGCHVQLRAQTVAVDAAHRTIEYCADDEQFRVEAKAIVLATGAKDRRLQVPGEEEMISRGEVYSASRDRDRFQGRPVAVIGGGDRAFEGALLLAERGADVYLIHRSTYFRARDEFIIPVQTHPRIRLIAPACVTAIDGDVRTEAVQVETADGRHERLQADAVFVRIGVEPSSALYRGKAVLDKYGFVQTDAHGCTSTEGLYAVGDVCTPATFSSIIHAAGQGATTAKRIYEQLQKKN